jgi:phthalate 4,5-dioxygenase
VLTSEENELLTCTGPGTPMGELFRRFFRDSRGNVGLLECYCTHRGADLFFGRNEESVLRCVYHGWKFESTDAASISRRQGIAGL